MKLYRVHEVQLD